MKDITELKVFKLMFEEEKKKKSNFIQCLYKVCNTGIQIQIQNKIELSLWL